MPGRMAGWGPYCGLNGTRGFCSCGAFGFVDTTNWWFVRLRHDVKSTVEPRYCEHLDPCVSTAHSRKVRRERTCR